VKAANASLAQVLATQDGDFSDDDDDEMEVEAAANVPSVKAEAGSVNQEIRSENEQISEQVSEESEGKSDRGTESEPESGSDIESVESDNADESRNHMPSDVRPDTVNEDSPGLFRSFRSFFKGKEKEPTPIGSSSKRAEHGKSTHRASTSGNEKNNSANNKGNGSHIRTQVHAIFGNTPPLCISMKKR
jgi:hypothetical protein